MAIEFVSYALDRCAVAGSDLLVLIALCEHADRRGLCWPSVATLERRTRLRRRAVQLALRRLEEAGEIVLAKPGGGIDGRSGRGRAARYIVAGGRPKAELAALQPDGRTAHDGAPFNGARIDAERRTDRHGTAHESTRNGAPSCAQTVIEPAAEPSSNREKQALTAAAENSEKPQSEAPSRSERPPPAVAAPADPEPAPTAFEKRRAELIAKNPMYSEPHFLSQRLLRDAGADERLVIEAAGVAPERIFAAVTKLAGMNGRIRNVGGWLRTELGLIRDMPRR